MAKFVVLVLSLFFLVNSSFAYVDKCGLIDLLNYKSDYYKTLSKLQNYPAIFSKVNKIAVEIFTILGNDVSKYKILITKLINYSYTYNLCKNSILFLEIKYLVYLLYDKYLSLSHHPSGIEKLVNLLSSN